MDQRRWRMDLKQAALESYLTQVSGEAVQIKQVRALGHSTTGAAALKAFGYGQPVCVDYQCLTDTKTHQLVVRQVNRNGFGRERDSDRIAEVWLDFTAFNHLPRHVQAYDIVALTQNGQL